MINLVLKNGELVVLELLVAVNLGSASRVLGNEGALAENGNMLLETTLLSEGLDIAHELVAGDALERVADLGLEVAGEINGGFGAAGLDLLALDVLAVCLTGRCQSSSPSD